MNQILIGIGSVQYRYSGTGYLNHIGIESVCKCWIGASLHIYKQYTIIVVVYIIPNTQKMQSVFHDC